MDIHPGLLMGILVDLRTGSLRPSYLPLVLVDSLSSVANILNQAVFENLFLDPKFVQTLFTLTRAVLYFV